MTPTPPAPAATPWPVPTLLKASAVCHVGALAAALAVPAWWPWALLALAVDHAVITVTGLWPRSTWLGKNVTRLPEPSARRGEIALTIDDGPDPQVTPAVLDLLEAAGVHATFFCIAERVQQHPALAREIMRRGHSVQNHTQHHSHRFSLSGPRGFEREITMGSNTLARVCGTVPRYFRAPAGLRNPFLAPVLHRLGLTLVSWTRRGFDTHESDPGRVLARLTEGLRGGDILLLHDGHAALTREGRPVVLDVLPALLQHCSDAGLRFVTLPEALDLPGAGETALREAHS